MSIVFFDIDTQRDFMEPSGALYVPGAETIIDRVGELNRWAASHGVPVVSTMDAHTPDDPEFSQWPPHCIAGTRGQQKPEPTLLESRIVIPNAPWKAADADQYLLEKQTTNCFSSRNLPALLDRLGAETCVVYGVVTEVCVKNAAMGLLETGRQVKLVTDAVRSLDDTAAAKFITEFQASGGELTDSAAVMR